MKTRLIFIIMSVVSVFACSPDEFKEYSFSNYTIDKVVCQASSNYLIADNFSELDLHVKLYSKAGTYIDRYGKERDKYIEIPQERRLEHDIKFYLENTEITTPYKTSSTTTRKLRFRAEVDGIKSSSSPAKILAHYPPETTIAAPWFDDNEEPVMEPDANPYYFEVTVKEAFTPKKRKINTVFHIIELNDDRKRGQELEESAIINIVNLLNDVYGRKNTIAPNGANPNLEFILANTNPSGAELIEPGINRVYISSIEDIAAITNVNWEMWIWNLFYSDNGKTTQMSSSIYNQMVTADNLPVRTPVAFWDPDKYLNIWIMYDKSQADIDDIAGRYMPMIYEIGGYDADKLPLPETWKAGIREYTEDEINMWKKNPGDLRLPPKNFSNKTWNLGQAGIYLKKGDVTNYHSNIITYVGAFFGLLPNTRVNYSKEYQYPPKNSSSSTKVWLEDFCEDTPNYRNWYDVPYNGGIELLDFGNNRIKYTMSPPYFVYRAYNIMEIGSYPSVVTQDQVKRMDWVLENAVGRQMWRSNE